MPSERTSSGSKEPALQAEQTRSGSKEAALRAGREAGGHLSSDADGGAPPPAPALEQQAAPAALVDGAVMVKRRKSISSLFRQGAHNLIKGRRTVEDAAMSETTRREDIFVGLPDHEREGQVKRSTTAQPITAAAIAALSPAPAPAVTPAPAPALAPVRAPALAPAPSLGPGCLSASPLAATDPFYGFPKDCRVAFTGSSDIDIGTVYSISEVPEMLVVRFDSAGDLRTVPVADLSRVTAQEDSELRRVVRRRRLLGETARRRTIQ